ncbi:hypothetical protein EJ08DRAFT_699747 [Tothia fuscella]|uniref:Amino acid permease/ SLC12A domain-containing protein n=1 Tax=Tothia fuscella TaxID=1048955 RepID=A0A9P4NL96_9PEZI|nr:hypothetical protein EJ08DRAFT_699747 [Tothia fuscella]
MAIGPDEDIPNKNHRASDVISPEPLIEHTQNDDDHEGDFVTTNETHDLARDLHQRHIGLIALAGAIGTGLFLGLGGSIQTGGPLGALLGYATVGVIVCAVQFALGEVTALLPVTGSFVRHAEFLVDPALGFAIGYNIVYGNWLSIPAEISAICVLFQYWTDVNSSIWIVLAIFFTFAVGISSIGIYGEIEFWFAMLKIFLIIFLIILGLVIDLGGIPGVPRTGFRFWKTPGPFVEYIATGSWGKFLGYWAVMNKSTIPRACKRVFFRVSVFYVLAVLIVGMLVASNDERLSDQSGTAAQSPFVIAASAAGIKAIPSVVNAVVISSAWSSLNQALLSGTRVLYGLALKKQAPKIFLRTTSWGVPYVCVLLQTAFMFLAFMSLLNGALTVFYWFLNLTACGVLISWITILVNHRRLILAMKKQGIPLSHLSWRNSWTVYSTPIALVFCVVILLSNGFSVFTRGRGSTSTFVSAYLDILLVIAAFLIWKLVKRTRIVSLHEIDLQGAFEDIRLHPEDLEPESTGWRRFFTFLWD